MEGGLQDKVAFRGAGGEGVSRTYTFSINVTIEGRCMRKWLLEAGGGGGGEVRYKIKELLGGKQDVVLSYTVLSHLWTTLCRTLIGGPWQKKPSRRPTLTFPSPLGA